MFRILFSATVIFHDDSNEAAAAVSNGFLVPPTINAQNRLIKKSLAKAQSIICISKTASLWLY